MLKINAFYSLFIAFFSTLLYCPDISPSVNSSTSSKVSQNVAFFCQVLGKYYKQMGQPNYYDKNRIGLFTKWTQGDEDKDLLKVMNNLKNNKIDDDVIDFDQNFPLPKIDTKLNATQKKEVQFFYMHYLYTHRIAPPLPKLKDFLNRKKKTTPPPDNICSKQANLVFGYARKSEKMFNLFIPNGVKLILLLFYYGKDYFDDGYSGKLIRTHNDQQIITMRKDDDTKINAAYGSRFINPSGPNSNKIYTWKFKIICCHGYIYIGIDDATATSRNDWFAGRRGTNNYSYCCNGRKYSHRTGGMGQSYNTGFYVGSVVLMELDLTSKKGMLSFGIMKHGNDWKNDAFFSVSPAFTHIKKNRNLRMAVNVRAGSTVQLLEYKEEVPKPKGGGKGKSQLM